MVHDGVAHLLTLRLSCAVTLALLTAVGAARAAAPEIIVTAERRPAPAAGAVAALDAVEIARIGAEHPAEALNRLPGVNIQRNNGLESLPAIRSPVLTGGQGAGSVLVLEDGTPIRAAPFGNVNQVFETSLAFAARIEVTRGPGSALYGANAIHGLVNVLTPTPGAAAGRLRLSADTVGRGAIEGLAPWRGASGAAGYAAVSIRREAGVRADAGLDQQSLLLAAAGAAGRWRADARFAAQNLAQETAGFLEGPQVYRDRALAKSNPTPEAYRDQRLARAHVRLERDLAPNLTLALTPYARAIETDLSLSFFPSRAQEVTRQVGAGAQAALYWDPRPALGVIAGLDGEGARFSLTEVQSRETIGTFPQGLHYDYAVAASIAAAFAQARWEFAPAWRAIAGVRAERIRLAYDNRAPDGDFGRFRRAPDRADAFAYTLGKFALSRDAGPATLFASLSQGARAPQATDLYSLQTGQTPGGQPAERIDAAELGARARGPGGTRLEIVGFAMEKRDGAFRGADGLTVTGADTDHQGVEIAAEAPLAPGLRLAGSYSWARHTYAFSRPADGVRRGARVDTAPERQGEARLIWSPRAGARVELAGRFVGRYFTDAANTRDYSGHTVFDLRAEARLSPSLILRLEARNLADEAYAERADFAFGTDRYFPGEPRRAALTLEWSPVRLSPSSGGG